MLEMYLVGCMISFGISAGQFFNEKNKSKWYDEMVPLIVFTVLSWIIIGIALNDLVENSEKDD